MASTWESHKETIRSLYLVQNKSQKQVMAEMAENHNFVATGAQYERQLKSWGFRKNLTSKEWAHVARRIEKRKSEGHDSEVIVDGVLVPEEKVRKKTSTHGYQTTFEKLETKLRASKNRSPSPEGIVVRTPSTSLMNDSEEPTESFAQSPSFSNVRSGAHESIRPSRKAQNIVTTPEAMKHLASDQRSSTSAPILVRTPSESPSIESEVSTEIAEQSMSLPQTQTWLEIPESMFETLRDSEEHLETALNPLPTTSTLPLPLTQSPPETMSDEDSLSSPSFQCLFPGCNALPFKTQYLLNSHINIHIQSEDRPYYRSGHGRPQREEGEAFNCEDEFIRHGLEHDSPGHVCPFCTERDHRYLRPDNLKRHVRIHHAGVDENDPHLRKALFLPQAGPCGRRNEEKKSWEAQFNEALSSDDLDTIRHLVASDSSKLNNHGRDSVYLPIEASIACDNVSVSMLLMDHGALTHRIRLEKLGLDLLIANMASIRPHLTFHEDYKYVRKAFVIKTHFEKVGREQFDALTRFRVAAIAGLSYAVAEYIGEGGVHIEGYEGYRALSIAARLRHIDVVRTLLDGGTPVNLKSRCSDAICPPIYWAIERGDYEMAELLLSRGAQTERQYCPDGAKCTMAGHEDYNSLISTLPTALQLAVLKRDKSMADSLIIFGADVCAPPMAENSEFYPLLWGKTTLEIALKVEPHYDTHLIQELLEAGADINTPKFDTSMGSKDDQKIRMRLMYAKSGSSSFVQAAAWKWNHYALSKSPRDAEFNGVSPKGFTALHMLFMNRTHFLRNDWLSSFKDIWFLLTFRGAEINNPQSIPLISAVVTCLLHEDLRSLKETKREILDFLIRQGLVCDDPRALGMAVVRKDTWLLRKLMEIAVEDPHLEHAALVVAVKMRYRPAVEILLQRRESVAQQCTVEAFNVACSMACPSIVRLLVSRGVSIQEAKIQDSCRPSIHENEGRIQIWCPEYDIMHSGRVESDLRIQTSWH